MSVRAWDLRMTVRFDETPADIPGCSRVRARIDVMYACGKNTKCRAWELVSLTVRRRRRTGETALHPAHGGRGGIGTGVRMIDPGELIVVDAYTGFA